MPYETCDTIPRVIPSAADGIAKAPADSYATGTWTEIASDSGADALMLLALAVRITSAAFGGTSIWEIGVGAAGAEAVIASWKVAMSHFNYTMGQHGNFSAPLPVNAIPAHSRIAVRARGGTFYGSPPTCAVNVVVQPAPAPLEIEVATSCKQARPSSGMASGTVNTTAWAWSPWAEITAATAAASLLAGFNVWFGQAGSAGTFQVEVEFGIGAAGAEVPLTSICDVCSNAGAKGNWGTSPFPVLYAVPSGSRIAARMRKTGTATLSSNWAADVALCEVPA